MKKIGTVFLGSRAIFSDPCYKEIDEKINVILDNVLPGNYTCYVHYFYDKDWCPNYRRIGSVLLKHESYLKVRTDTQLLCRPSIDSGQFGIFDSRIFNQPRYSKKRWYIFDRWYDGLKTCVEVKNKNYLPYEKSKYYYNGQDIDKRFDSLFNYQNDRNISSKTVHAQSVDIRDFYTVFASAYGDFSPKIYIGLEKDNGQVVSIKVNFKN